MYSRLIKPPKAKSFFLFGPRGTGKTTWVKSNFPAAIYLDLLEAEVFNDLLANPQRLENFILTGSSARKLRRKGHNLLAGRALTYALHPLTVKELGKDFSLAHSLNYGHLPCAYTEANPKDYLESYVKTYLEEEVRQEGLTRNLAAFSRFLEAASFSQGSILNISSVARDCSVERKVVETYFTILEDLLIGYRLPVFTKRAKRRLISHPKFYFFDAGVYRTLRPMGPLDMPEEAEGIALETLLFQELVAINDALNLGYSISYWRTSNNMEVDFVLYGNKGIRAFEVKRSGRIPKSMLSGLMSFLRDYPMAKAYFVYGGKRYMREEAIEVIPVEDILKRLPEILS